MRAHEIKRDLPTPTRCGNDLLDEGAQVGTVFWGETHGGTGAGAHQSSIGAERNDLPCARDGIDAHLCPFDMLLRDPRILLGRAHLPEFALRWADQGL